MLEGRGLKGSVSPLGKKQSNKQSDAGTRRRGDAEQENARETAYTERAHISFAKPESDHHELVTIHSLMLIAIGF